MTVTRRELLRTSAAGAAGLFIAFHVPSGLRAAQAAPAPAPPPLPPGRAAAVPADRTEVRP